MKLLKKTRWFVALLLAAALIFASCSNGSDDDDSSATSSTESTTTESTADNATDSSSNNTSEASNESTAVAKDITVDASELAATLEGLSSGTYNITVTGVLSSDIINAVKSTLYKRNSEYVALDLSGTTGLTKIEDNAFELNSNSLISLKLPESVTSIGEKAFAKCYSLKSISLPSSLASIGAAAFRYCSSLESITIPSGVTGIDRQTFESCSSLSSVTILGNITSIGTSAFLNCKELSSITLPDSVTHISSRAFEGTAIESFSFPSGVTGFADVFSDYTNNSYNTSLKSVTIPDSVTQIDRRAFAGCTSLSSITYSGTVEQWKSITKGTDWNKEVPATEVVCSDGEVSL